MHIWYDSEFCGFCHKELHGVAIVFKNQAQANFQPGCELDTPALQCPQELLQIHWSVNIPF